MDTQKKKSIALSLLILGIIFGLFGLTMVVMLTYFMVDRISTVNYLNEHGIGAMSTIEEIRAECLPPIVTFGLIFLGSTIATVMGVKKFKYVKQIESEENKIRAAELRDACQSHTKELKFWFDNVYNPMLQKFEISHISRTVAIKKSTITLTDEEAYYTEVDNYIFISDNNLCLLPTYKAYSAREHIGYYGDRLENELENFFSLIQIPLNNIEHFYVGGEFYREQKISGGGGGGSSLGGAIVGGMIAGDVGAIIGSRQKTEAIKSELITHDSREVVLVYIDNGTRKSIVFNHKDYQTLEDLIPEKSYTVVAEVKKQALVQQGVKVDDSKVITEQIKELAKLKNDGILTEEEFTTKKKELLAKM